jgi:hypothetical protein
MPLFNIHTFMALTVVLIFGLFLEGPGEIKFIVGLARREGSSGLGRLISHPKTWPEIFRSAPIRVHAAAMLALALIPASFFVWLVTDHFRAASVLQWHPGWNCEFRICHHVWFAIAKNVEWRDRPIFSVLAAKLRLVGSPGDGARWVGRLAYLENRLALG